MAISCSSAYYSSSRVYNDDLYSTHDTREIAQAAAAQQQHEYRQAQQVADAARQVYGGQVVSSGNPYQDVLADTYEDARARRERGFESPTYNMPDSYYSFRYSSASNYVSAYDPAFYNVIVMGDQVWVEPRYITAMFGTWGTPSIYMNMTWGGYWGWRSPYRWGVSWGWSPWYNTYYGWGCSPYWGGYSPYYCGWGGSWGWGWDYYGWGGYRGGGYYPHYGPGWGGGGHYTPGGYYTDRYHTYRPSYNSGTGTYSGNRSGYYGGRSTNVPYSRNGASSRSGSYDSRRPSSSQQGTYTPSRGSSSNSSGWGRSGSGSSSSSSSGSGRSRPSYDSGSSSRGSYSGSSSSSSSSGGGYSGGGSSSGGSSGGGGGNTRR
jgi:hypothetical protein